MSAPKASTGEDGATILVFAALPVTALAALRKQSQTKETESGCLGCCPFPLLVEYLAAGVFQFFPHPSLLPYVPLPFYRARARAPFGRLHFLCCRAAEVG